MRIFFLVITIFICGCNTTPKHAPRIVERSFYYWKSIFKLSDTEKQALAALDIRTLYIKFFDVAWNEEVKAALPIAQIRFSDSVYLKKTSKNIIPTIFITNECFYKIDTSQIALLAQKILLLTKGIISNNSLQNIAEIQIDCDWTAGTKDKYFTLLEQLQNLDKTINLSATIRLHQIKFIKTTGVPPVPTGMLMCYNMGNLTNIATNNSILETDELKKYIGGLQNYPLPLDVAFPLFEWKVLFRKDKFKSLINDLPENSLVTSICKKNTNRYTFLRDTTLSGIDFKKGDILRNENTSYKEILKAAEMVSKKLTRSSLRVSLYHLDTVTLKKITTHEMENVFNALH